MAFFTPSSFYQRTAQKNFNKSTVIESTGPEGKIRGTSQQLMEKYLTLGKEALREKDVALAQNFFQHADHYGRLFQIQSGQKGNTDYQRPQGYQGNNNRHGQHQGSQGYTQGHPSHQYSQNHGHTNQNQINPTDDQNNPQGSLNFNHHQHQGHQHQNRPRFQRPISPNYQGQRHQSSHYNNHGNSNQNTNSNNPSYQGQQPNHYQQRPKFQNRRPMGEDGYSTPYVSQENIPTSVTQNEEKKIFTDLPPLSPQMQKHIVENTPPVSIPEISSVENALFIPSDNGENQHKKTPKRRRILKKEDHISPETPSDTENHSN